MSFPCAGLDITGHRTAQHSSVTLERDLISTPYGITMSYSDDNGSEQLLALPIKLWYDTAACLVDTARVTPCFQVYLKVQFVLYRGSGAVDQCNDQTRGESVTTCGCLINYDLRLPFLASTFKYTWKHELRLTPPASRC